MSKIGHNVSRILIKASQLGTEIPSIRAAGSPIPIPVSIEAAKKHKEPNSSSPIPLSSKIHSSQPSQTTVAIQSLDSNPVSYSAVVLTKKPLPPICNIPVREQNMNLTWPFPHKPGFFWKARSTLTVFMVGLWGKSVLSWMNRTRIINKQRMADAIFNRPEGTALVTVSNHESCIDDPLLIAAFMNAKQLADHKNMRWSLAAYDICFRSKLESSLFSLGKCVPTIRGGGVYQRAVDFAIERVNAGDWIHIFPEGRINTERQELHRLKWGIGRILTECQKPLHILPFWHTGMANVLPNHPPYIPRFGKEVLINVGEPIDIREILISIQEKSAMERRKIVTDFIQAKLKSLREETLQLSSKLKSSDQE